MIEVRLKGNKVPVMVYIDPNVYIKLETVRGEIKRSTYLEKMITKEIKLKAC